MKKLLMILLLFSMFLLGCAEEENISIEIQAIETNLSIGDSYELRVIDNNNNLLDNQDLLWDSTDYNICKVDKQGKLIAKDYGLATIKAKLKSDLSVTSEIDIFISYKTVEEVNIVKEKMEGDMTSSRLDDVIAKYASKYGKIIVKSLAGKLSDFAFYKTIIDVLITKDTYMFSMTYPGFDIKNGIVFYLSDWTNYDSYVSLDKLTSKELSKNIAYSLFLDSKNGKTITEFVETIKSEIMGQLPDNNLYKFSLMNRNYQYRVVVRADFQTVLVQDLYSTGAGKGIVDTILGIGDIGNWTFDYIFNNFGREELVTEVLNIKNIKLCIEYRKRG